MTDSYLDLPRHTNSWKEVDSRPSKKGRLTWSHAYVCSHFDNQDVPPWHVPEGPYRGITLLVDRTELHLTCSFQCRTQAPEDLVWLADNVAGLVIWRMSSIDQGANAIALRKILFTAWT